MEIYSGSTMWIVCLFATATAFNISLKMWAPKYQCGQMKLGKLEAHMAPGVLKLFATLYCTHICDAKLKTHHFQNMWFQDILWKKCWHAFSFSLVVVYDYDPKLSWRNQHEPFMYNSVCIYYTFHPSYLAEEQCFVWLNSPESLNKCWL